MSLSLCKNCWCMTKTLKGICGKCKGNKMTQLKDKQLRKIIVTPVKMAFDRFCADNELNQRDCIWIKREEDFDRVRGLCYKHQDVIYLDYWFNLPNVKQYLLALSRG